MRDQELDFVLSEGDAWWNRNCEKVLAVTNWRTDPTLRAIADQGLNPRRVLEVGCANGWRLSFLHTLTGADCHGIDASKAAIADGRHRYPALDLRFGLASSAYDGPFDMVIAGFVLYLVDRDRLFTVGQRMYEGVAPGGHLVITDFAPYVPETVSYRHKPGLFSHKLDYGGFFQASGLFELVTTAYYDHETGEDCEPAGCDPNNRCAVWVLRKRKEGV